MKAFSLPLRADAICIHQSPPGHPLPCICLHVSSCSGTGLTVKTGIHSIESSAWTQRPGPRTHCVDSPYWTALRPAPGGLPGHSRWSTGLSTHHPHQVRGCRRRLQTPPARWKKYSARDHSMSLEDRGTGLSGAILRHWRNHVADCHGAAAETA